MTDGDDRDRGVLSPADRQFLRSPEEYSRQATHEREKAIRERVWNAILDFELLANMPPEQRQRVLASDDPYDEQHKPASHMEFEVGLTWMIAFAHQLATDLGTPVEPLPPDNTYKSRDFERRLQDGLERAYVEENLVLEDLTLQIDAQKVPGLNTIRERLEGGRSPSPQTIQYLLETDEIELKDYLEFLAEQLDVEPHWQSDADEQETEE